MKPAARLCLAAAIALASAGPGWSADAPQVAPIDVGVADRSQYFIGNTIEKLRGLDPGFLPGQKLELVDSRRVVTGGFAVDGPAPASAPGERVISCNFTLHASALVDTAGGRSALPSHGDGTLRACTSTGTGSEVLLVFRAMRADRPHNFARVVDNNGKLLADAEFDQAGILEFTVAGKQYVAQVPAP